MYTVISGYKRTSQRRTIAATAVLLMACSALAWLWTRRGAESFELDQPVVPSGWDLVLHLPSDWERVEASEVQERGRLLFRAGADESAGDRLFVSRRESSEYASPERIGPDVALQDIEVATSDVRYVVDLSRDVTFGDLHATLLVFQLARPTGRTFQITVAACSPDGVVYALSLQTQQRRLLSRLALIEQIAAAVEFTSMGLTTEPDWSRQALRFDAPAGTRYIASTRREAERVRCLAPLDDRHAWQLDVTRTWLADGQSPRDVLANRLMDRTHNPTATVTEVALPRGSAFRVDGRAASQFTNDAFEMWCVRLNDDSAALITGRGRDRAVSAVHALCRRVAETVQPVLGDAIVDVTAAMRRGEAVVIEIRQRGLETWWKESRVEDWYSVVSPSRAVGFYRAAREHNSGDAEAAYRVTGAQFFRSPISDIPLHFASRWRVLSDVTSFRGAVLYREPTRDDEVVYRGQERIEAGQDSIRRSRAISRRLVEDEVLVTANFAGEPVLELAQFLVASHPESGPAIFSTSGRFNRKGGLHTVFCLPLDRVTVTVRGTVVRTWALLVREDYDHSYTILYFADDGTLVREQLEEWLDVRLTDRVEIENQFPVDPVLRELTNLGDPFDRAPGPPS